MQLGNVEFGAVTLRETGLNAEQLQPSKAPVEIDHAQQIFKQTRESFRNVSGSNTPNEQELGKLAKQLNSVTESLNIHLRFSVEKVALGIIHVQMVDTDTNEVIREIPAKKMSAVGSHILDAVGLIIDKLA